MESRRFHRITYTAPAVLVYHDFTYRGSLANISLRGALVSANECIMISPGEHCVLTIHPEGSEETLLFQAEVIHSFYSMVGLKFLLADDDWIPLYQLLQRISPDLEKLDSEWQHIQMVRSQLAATAE